MAPRWSWPCWTSITSLFLPGGSSTCLSPSPGTWPGHLATTPGTQVTLQNIAEVLPICVAHFRTFRFFLSPPRKLCGISEEKHVNQPNNRPKCDVSRHGVLGVSFFRAPCFVMAIHHCFENDASSLCLPSCLCRRRALRISSGIDHMGSLNWDLALCLFIAWVICYFCIWKGTKSTGKVGERNPYFSCLFLSYLKASWRVVINYFLADLFLFLIITSPTGVAIKSNQIPLSSLNSYTMKFKPCRGYCFPPFVYNWVTTAKIITKFYREIQAIK